MWYIDTDNVIRVVGLRNVVTGAYVNNATVTGILYKLPVLNPDAAAAVNKGAGKVGIPCEGHGQVGGGSIRIERSLYYNGDFTLDADTSENELVIVTTYKAEVFTGEEFIYCAIVGTADVPITFTYEYGSNGCYVGTIPHDAPLVQDASYVMCIKELSGTEQVLAKVIYEAGYQGM